VKLPSAMLSRSILHEEKRKLIFLKRAHRCTRENLNTYMAFLKTEAPAPLHVAPGILASLNNPVFAALFAFSFASNIGTWVQDVGASWLMTSLAPSPVMVSLIQTAGNLPYFLFGVLAGTLADIADRRRLLIVSQAWMLVSAGALGILTLLHVTLRGFCSG
jgi:hypothetical protein